MKIKTNLTGTILAAAALSLGACAKNTPPPAEPVAAEPEPAPVAALATPVETSESHFVEGVAGGVMLSTLTLQAEVVSVDQEKREAVLRGPEGKEVTVRVGKGAVNFYQVSPGDKVNVTMARELVIYVPDSEESGPDGTAVAAAGAEKGDTPAGAVLATTKVTSTIDSIDLEARKATLSFEDGHKETFEVRPDVDMTKYKVGQQVVFLVTEMLALEVEKI